MIEVFVKKGIISKEAALEEIKKMKANLNPSLSFDFSLLSFCYTINSLTHLETLSTFEMIQSLPTSMAIKESIDIIKAI